MFKKRECRLFPNFALQQRCQKTCAWVPALILVQQSKLGSFFFFGRLHAIPRKCSTNWQFQDFFFFVPLPSPRPYIHDGLGMVPQTRQAESGLQASHWPCETLQHGRGSPEAQAATLQLIELAALGEHLEGVLKERVEVWIRILPARPWALSGRHPRQDSQLL